METNKFWMLWVEEEEILWKAKYETEKEAREEAERMARRSCHRVFLLEATDICLVDTTVHPVRWIPMPVLRVRDLSEPQIASNFPMKKGG